jgi:hypothetical protein
VESARQKYLDPLIGVANARVHYAKVSPVIGFMPGLFQQLAPGGHCDILSGVNLAGGQF